ncbi:aminodeoxychorismate synthase component I [Sulfurimonas sp.]|uniref:aminodeoxychorismate synthase component I n=1 Tax=Sulfurimonas sp. TaxID=2022749 RepID=UPI002AB08AB4|nr:aminodeoxychorismate synthase component I [Sulfurimonas sp.]
MTINELNRLAKDRVPFLFISDFLAQNIKVIPLNELYLHDIDFCIDENYKYKKHSEFFEKESTDFNSYKEKFENIIQEIKSGNTYLLNLTAPTEVKSDLSLKEIYLLANAHYKLRYKDKFVCFSPEKFIQIKDNKINAYPMKGTIDASLVDAKQKILKNEKEMAEHIMVVDLLRNDLSIVANNVKVQKFRYVQEIDSGEKKLLQVSSHISGDIGDDWRENLGNILNSLLPAGSISGTPKKSTLEIIKKTEAYDRGYFSGIFGIFDGESFDSGVMIRFVQKTKNGYIYKSGGGITLDSDASDEYSELLDKIYLP